MFVLFNYYLLFVVSRATYNKQEHEVLLTVILLEKLHYGSHYMRLH